MTEIIWTNWIDWVEMVGHVSVLQIIMLEHLYEHDNENESKDLLIS